MLQIFLKKLKWIPTKSLIGTFLFIKRKLFLLITEQVNIAKIFSSYHSWKPEYGYLNSIRNEDRFSRFKDLFCESLRSKMAEISNKSNL